MRKKQMLMGYLVCWLLLFGFFINLPMAQEAKKELPKIIRWGTLQVGAANYQESVGMGEIIKKYTPMDVKIEPTLGDLVWGPLLSKGELDFGCQSFTGPLWGYYGLGPYKEKGALKNLRLVGQGTPLIYAVITTKGAGIKKMSDLKGKRVAHPAGIFYMKDILVAALETNKIAEKDLKIVDSTTAAEMKNDLINGRIDAFIFALAPVILEVDTAKGAYVIPFTKAEQDHAVKKVRGVKEITSPPGLFGMPSSPQVYTPASVLTRADQRDDVVYEIAKAVYGHTAELSTFGPTLAGYHLGRALAFPALPYHPGAIKYYKEKWLWTEVLEKNNNQLLTEEQKKK